MSRNLLRSFICLLRSFTIHGRVKISRKAEAGPAGIWSMDVPNLVSLASAITASQEVSAEEQNMQHSWFQGLLFDSYS